MRLKRGTLPVVMLVVVVAWALFAVVLLTGTLITAQQIDNRVEVINSEVKPINKDLDSVRLALETGRIAGEINKAAKPLDDQLAQVVKLGDGIEVSAASVSDRAREINATAKSINSTVGEIGSTVGEIGSSVESIGSSISSVNASAGEINASVDGISGSFVGILGEVRLIHGEVLGINNRADIVTAISQAIKADTGQILGLVVDINQNATAIANSPLLLRNIDILNQMAAALPAPAPAAPGAEQPLPIAPALPLPDVLPGLPLPAPALPLPDAGGLLPGAGLVQSSSSDTGNLLGALR